MTKRLFLTSSVETPGIAKDIRSKIEKKGELRTAFVMTPAEAASESSDLSWLDGERDMLNQAGFTTIDYSITGKSEGEIRKDLADIDVLYISGGNEFYLKQESKKCNFAKFVQEFVDSGKPYIASSGGSIIVGEDMSPLLILSDTNDLDDPAHPDIQGFNIVNFTILPHWGSKEFRDQYLGNRIQLMYDSDIPMILLTNNQYVEVTGDSFEIISLSS